MTDILELLQRLIVYDGGEIDWSVIAYSAAIQYSTNLLCIRQCEDVHNSLAPRPRPVFL